MREKIKKLSKGIFEYEQPDILLSQEMLIIEIEEGTRYQGSFCVKNSTGAEMKGVVYSSSPFMKIGNSTFTEAETTIEYEFCAESISVGGIVAGTFSIVSTCGEVELPFSVTVVSPSCTTSMGKIKDLFLFANLAKTEPNEAVSIFCSEDFERVFLQEDMKKIILYRGLKKSSNLCCGMEEFLIAVHKKLPITIAIQRNTIEYQIREEVFMDKVLLTKDQWGYTQLQVWTDAPFIQIEQNTILTDHFIGNSYELEYVLDAGKMRSGNNYGKIYIQSIRQNMEIEIKVICQKGNAIQDERHAQKRDCILRLLQNYLNFRTHKFEAEYYAEESLSILSELGSISKDRRVELIRTHFYIVSGREGLVHEQIEKLEQDKEMKGEESVLDYCTFLYLKALAAGDLDVVKRAVEEISVYYEQGYRNWQILWLLLYLDSRYENNKHLRMQAIVEQIENGCHSPVMYYEICAIFNEEPELFSDLNRSAVLALHWGIKASAVSTEVMNQYVYLAGKEKNFHPFVFQNLCMLYEQENSLEILGAICSMLIRGHKSGNRYFKWYSLGVENQLRITELHEHYMYSLDEKEDTILPQQILLYFVYDSTLSDRKKAFLYAYIIKNKNSNPSIYHTYAKQMQGFALKQLVAHNISNSLAVIYEEFFSEDNLDEQVARHLPYVMFQHEIVCLNRHIIGVCVIHKELEEESYVLFTDGVAQLSICTENAELFFVDSNHNRYVENIRYTIHKLLHLGELEQRCYHLCSESIQLLMSMFDKIENYQKFDQNSIFIRKRIFELPSLREQYKKSSFLSLINHYYDNYEETGLRELLAIADTIPVDVVEQSRIIEYCILHNLDYKVVDYMRNWGYEKVPVNRLQRLCLKLISDILGGEDEFTVQLAFAIFSAGKYDITLVGYLLKYYIGTTKDMYEIWDTGEKARMDTKEMEERLLAQILFTENNMIEGTDVFLSYYQNPRNPLIIRAYLSYAAYKYLLNDRVIHPEIFEIFRKESAYEENEITMLALLKYYSENAIVTEQESSFVDYNMHKFIEKGIILPFFQKFKSKIQVPHHILRQYYVEYKGDPNHIIKIHYQTDLENEDGEFITEVMENIYQGIHVKGFLLFYNEIMQYYITEVYNGEEIITESIHVKMEPNIEEQSDNKYSLLNLMIMARDMQDEKTLIELMKQYARTNYVEQQLFRPI